MSSYTRGRDAIRVALIAIVAGISFLGCFLYVTNRGLGLNKSDLHVRIATADGLRKGDPVIYRGVSVGEVKDLIFMEDGTVLVRARLTQRVPLAVNAVAELVAVDLFGRQSLTLRNGAGVHTPLASGDTIEGVAPASMTVKMSELGERAERVVSDTMIVLLHETLAGAAAATRQLAALSHALERTVSGQQASLARITSETAGIAENLRIASAPDELVQTRGNLQRATARLDTTSQALIGLLAGLDEGNGSAGKLLRDDALYDRTNALLLSLEELVKDVKTNPKRYINVKVF